MLMAVILMEIAMLIMTVNTLSDDNNGHDAASDEKYGSNYNGNSYYNDADNTSTDSNDSDDAAGNEDYDNDYNENSNEMGNTLSVSDNSEGAASNEGYSSNYNGNSKYIEADNTSNDSDNSDNAAGVNTAEASVGGTGGGEVNVTPDDAFARGFSNGLDDGHSGMEGNSYQGWKLEDYPEYKDQYDAGYDAGHQMGKSEREAYPDDFKDEEGISRNPTTEENPTAGEDLSEAGGSAKDDGELKITPEYENPSADQEKEFTDYLNKNAQKRPYGGEENEEADYYDPNKKVKVDTNEGN